MRMTEYEYTPCAHVLLGLGLSVLANNLKLELYYKVVTFSVIVTYESSTRANFLVDCSYKIYSYRVKS